MKPIPIQHIQAWSSLWNFGSVFIVGKNVMPEMTLGKIRFDNSQPLYLPGYHKCAECDRNIPSSKTFCSECVGEKNNSDKPITRVR